MKQNSIKKYVKSCALNLFTLIGVGFSIKVGIELYKGRTITEPEPFTYVTKAVKITTDQATQTVAEFTEKFKSQNSDNTEYQQSLVHLSTILDEALKYLSKEDSLSNHEQNQLIGTIKSLQTQLKHLDKYYKHNPLEDESVSGPAGSSLHLIHQRNLERKRLALVNKVEACLKRISNEVNGVEEEMVVAHTADDGIIHAYSLLKTLVR